MHLRDQRIRMASMTDTGGSTVSHTALWFRPVAFFVFLARILFWPFVGLVRSFIFTPPTLKFSLNFEISL